MDLSATFNSLAGSSEAKKVEGEDVAGVVGVEAIAGDSVVAMAGSTDWVRAVKGAAGKIGTKDSEEGPEQFNRPTIIGGPLLKAKISSLAVGPSAGHVVMLSASQGAVWVMGLNTSGQLGLGPEHAQTSAVRAPTLAPLWLVEEKKRGSAASSKKVAVKAAVGKNHTLLLYEDGSVASAGYGLRGALGRGNRKGDLVEKVFSPGNAAVLGGAADGDSRRVVDVAAGCDFSLAVTRDGSLYSWGWSECGKLGQGSDGSYNTKDSSIKMTFTAVGEPAKVAFPILTAEDDDVLEEGDKGPPRVVNCSAGKNHAACVCADGSGYTWGDGSYGKLGHRAQEMRTAPTRLKDARFTVLYCGDSTTCGLGFPEYRGRKFTKPPAQRDGMLYIWGVLKGTHGEGATRPRAEAELQGWNIKCQTLAMGAAHVCLHADDSAIAWAQSAVAFGQLGYGDKGPKSSHKPQKIHSLDGVDACAQVTAHAGASLFLFDTDKAKKSVLDDLPVWTPPEGPDVFQTGQIEDDDNNKKNNKKKAAAGGPKKPAAKKSKKK